MNEQTDDISNDSEEVERGLPPVNRHRTGGIRSKVVPTLFFVGMGLALAAVNGVFSDSEEGAAVQKDERGDFIQDTLPPLPPPPKPKVVKKVVEKKIPVSKAPPPPPKIAPVIKPTSRKKQKIVITPKQRKRRTGVIAKTETRGRGKGSGGSSTQGSSYPAVGSYQDPASPVDEAGTSRADSLDKRLGATKLKGSSASVIVDRSRIITKGTFLDCALETALNSDVPGMTSCILSRDVLSSNGKLVMLEAGSKVVGEYRSNLKRGQARLFVLWTRIETPNGVIINLDSPGTDALGRSGLSGHIDTHFWERFGSAIMLSLIDDVGAYVSNKMKDGEGDNNNIQFGNSADAAQSTASIALENSVNIPPTLVKHHGDHINIFVARDLDFRGVYGYEISRK